MSDKLHILILEDVASDAELMEDELTQAGFIFDAKRVAGRAAFIKELEEFSPDLILADYSLPGFDGKAALKSLWINPLTYPLYLFPEHWAKNWQIELVKKGATD